MADKETRLKKRLAKLEKKEQSEKFDTEKFKKKERKRMIAGRSSKYGRLSKKIGRVSDKLEKISSGSKDKNPY